MPTEQKHALFSGLNIRFVTYFLLFSYVPLVIFSVLGYYLNRNIIRQIHVNNLAEQARLSNEQIENYLELLTDEIINLVEHRPMVIQSPHLATQLEQSGFFEMVIIFENKKVIHGSANHVHEMTTIMEGNEKRGKFLFSPIQKKVYINCPVNEKIQVLAALNSSAQAALLNPPQQNVSMELISERQSIRLSGEGVSPLSLLNSETNTVQRRGTIGDIFYNPLQISAEYPMSTDWSIHLSKSTNGIYGALRLFLNQIIAANLFIGVLMLVSAIVLSRRITNPIDDLILAANKISKGDLSQPIQTKSRAEIKILAEEFELMRQKLQESYTTLETKIEERTRALREAQFQISHQEKMASLGLLAAGVAHEIGNPLTSISSMAQLIKRKVTDQQFNDYLNTILQNIERISKIVRELVDFAKPSGYEATMVDVNDLLRDAVNIVKYDRRTKNINIQLQLDEQLPHLYLVADQLMQVFINILINAVDALKDEKGLISIHSFVHNNHVHLDFIDNGVGIPKENLTKIFEPFFTTKQVGKGTGLGLSVSYGIIKNLNGSIKVKSILDEGSTFIIELPLNQSGAPT